jgi:coA-substrate-specific enzyme activase domain protein
MENTRPIFTKAMRKTHTILAPQMSPIHFELLEAAFRHSNYNFEILQEATAKTIDVGLKYVNNDACYPAILVTGQMIEALQSGRYDLERVALAITQTGGGCRATNYIGFIRRALNDAGFSKIPVIAISAQGFEKNPGFTFSLPMLSRVAKAICLGDLLMRVIYRTRPYERDAGSVNALHKNFAERIKTELKHLSHFRYKKLIRDIVKAFDEIPLRHVHKPRVGVVGEILVKFHPAANNEIVKTLEAEGAEAVMPDLLDFMLYSSYGGHVRHNLLGAKQAKAFIASLSIWALEQFRKPCRKALKNSKRFTPPESIYELAKGVDGIVQLGNIMGEGWFLTAEMVELIQSGVPNIACIQPFACLPNHVTGKGMIKELRRRYPDANIAAIDFDPGASEVNQLNRLKLLLATAKNGSHPDD